MFLRWHNKEILRIGSGEVIPDPGLLQEPLCQEFMKLYYTRLNIMAWLFSTFLPSVLLVLIDCTSFSAFYNLEPSVACYGSFIFFLLYGPLHNHLCLGVGVQVNINLLQGAANMRSTGIITSNTA